MSVRTCINLRYLPVNMAYVWCFGDNPISINGIKFFETKFKAMREMQYMMNYPILPVVELVGKGHWVMCMSPEELNGTQTHN